MFKMKPSNRNGNRIHAARTQKSATEEGTDAKASFAWRPRRCAPNYMISWPG